MIVILLLVFIPLIVFGISVGGKNLMDENKEHYNKKKKGL